MDAVTLPLVEPGVTIANAVKLLKERQRSGLVVEKSKEHYRLHYIGGLLEARDEGKPATVGGLKGGYDLLIPDQKITTRFGLDLIRPFRTGDAYVAALTEGGRDYALIAKVRDTVAVVTRKEDFGRMLSDTAGGYRCTGPDTHYFPEPGVHVGKACPKCHGVIVAD
jgi:hypothetical protein